MATRDAEATKARIFEAATEEFAAHGIAGARVDRIAQNAQANKQLIYAYFGDKKKLFYKVLDKTLVQVAEMVSTDITDLDRWVDEHIDYHQKHPELLRLLMWEALEVEESETCRGETRAERYAVKVQKIADAQDQGLARKDIPPTYMLMMLMSMINYGVMLPQVRNLVFGSDFDAEALRQWTKDAVKRVAKAAE
ncbi:TetR family transcriptional regulator [Actinospica sp.]|jgi:AcrR family transcriptional regulator|uniref:TetR family transcriptional regulator n=1 Tax=Actinospica sp. TaxID=1872142 RepID=UPI002D092411|nr:TetR family transcriptional regulator [Actinospica sp.]HWG22805.1 TetR family transcriptional regulator [Actinospica sp.]